MQFLSAMLGTSKPPSAEPAASKTSNTNGCFSGGDTRYGPANPGDILVGWDVDSPC